MGRLATWIQGVLRGPGAALEGMGVTEITTEAGFAEALERSTGGPVFLFKHSTACPVSAAAHHRVSDYLSQTPDAPPFYLVKVIESRPVSNAIAAKLAVTHQSPQLILLRGGEAAWHRSHNAISADAIREALA